MLYEVITAPFNFQFPTIVGEVLPNSPAEKAGIMANDSIVSIDSIATPFFHSFADQIKQFKGDTVTIGLYRNNTFSEIETVVSSQGTIGFYNKMDNNYRNNFV